MLCEKCQKRAANVHYTQIINGRRKELHVCSQCAKDEGYLGGAGLSGLDFGGFFSPDLSEGVAAENAVCPVCGMGINAFISGGKFGCESCYNAFPRLVDATLKKVHTSASHVGKLPGREGAALMQKRNILQLKKELSEAVLSEQYEKAARLRDKIKEMEGQA